MPTSNQIPLLLVDDHPVVVEGLKALLRTEVDLPVAAQAYSGDEALDVLTQHPEIRVAVLDLNMPGMTGVELAYTIRQTYPKIRILILSMFHDHASVAEVLEAGCAGYVLKTASKAELSGAIREVAAGRTYFSSEVAATVLQNIQIPASREQIREARASELTNREREVLQLIAREYSNSHIAETLFISERTVETHRKNILTKTNSKSVVGLIQYALRNRLIS
ncbi:response regulator [Hymenobacter wooponensis]|uniref:Response regulator transcription factor n=1 Tax=Hymenobacter wooponensis TaxID=1525360 RepID=A0A4Z0MTQ2_9BACT|nr:response regulator transcription factor [Hymenobacter wooponensis]TGD82686.1 response regulator transcription factor [Hymenobacter wooponensis]